MPILSKAEIHLVVIVFADGIVAFYRNESL